MASFSFSSGNASKLARIPLYLLGRLATSVVPRGDSWVFGSGAGIADGPLALYRRASADGVRAVWLVRSERDAADAAALGIRTLPAESWQGFLATARAGVVVVSHGLGDANRYAEHGAFLVQLWHGIPLKRIGVDSPETLRSPLFSSSRHMQRMLAFLYRRTMSGIRILPAASHLVRGRLESAFGLSDDRIVVTGEPRVDVLSSGTSADRHQDARALLESRIGPLPATVLLYAPTWRDGEADPAIPRDGDWTALLDVLKRHDAVLLVRSHPLGEGSYEPPVPTDRVRMLGSDVLRDVTPALPGLSALITDYSSLAYDVGLIPIPTLYLAPDLAAYEYRRGFYGRYADVAGDDHATSWQTLTAQLDELLTEPATRARRTEDSAALSARVHAHSDGRNTERVYREIRGRLARPRWRGRR